MMVKWYMISFPKRKNKQVLTLNEVLGLDCLTVSSLSFIAKGLNSRLEFGG